jgi:hypothetical protein
VIVSGPNVPDLLTGISSGEISAVTLSSAAKTAIWFWIFCALADTGQKRVMAAAAIKAVLNMRTALALTCFQFAR